MNISFLDLKELKGRSKIPAWISRQDLCACGLRRPKPDNCDGNVHIKRKLLPFEVACLLSHGFGHIGGRVAVYQGRVLFSPSKVLKVLTAGFLGANAPNTYSQFSKTIVPTTFASTYSQDDVSHGVPFSHRAALTHQSDRSLANTTPHTQDATNTLKLDRHKVRTPPPRLLHMLQSLPLWQLIPHMTKPLQVRVPIQISGTLTQSRDRRKTIKDRNQVRNCPGILLVEDNLCVVAPDSTIIADAQFMAGKAAMILRLLLMKMPKTTVSKRPLIIQIVNEKKASYQPGRNIITISQNLLMSSEIGAGILLHEMAHFVEKRLPKEVQSKFKDLWYNRLEDLTQSPGVTHTVIDYKNTFNYAGKWPESEDGNPQSRHAHSYAEFFATFVEAWFESSSREVLNTRNNMRSLRVVKNRADIIALYPDVAIVLDEYLPLYTWNNAEIDNDVIAEVSAGKIAGADLSDDYGPKAKTLLDYAIHALGGDPSYPTMASLNHK